MRDYLVYVPCNRGQVAAEMFGDARLYDVALNDYTGTSGRDMRAEYSFSMAGHKWPVIASMPSLFSQYKAVCFLDDDIEIDADQLNRLFEIGRVLGLLLWQAALTKDSYASWPHLVQVDRSYIRWVRTVEIMMPIFSHAALTTCWSSFSESQSGWGLDDLWPKLLDGKGLAVVDAVSARHARRVRSSTWTMPNGKRPQQERNEIEAKYDLREWQRENGLEPWHHD